MTDSGEKRFIPTSNGSGVWFIKDSKDNTLVCIMQKGNRGTEKTRAMMNVMLNALNEAVARRIPNE